MPKHCRHFTNTKQFRNNNKWDFSLVVKVCREYDDVTSAGKLFHVRAAATGNARLPTVDSRVDGTSNAEVDDDQLTKCRRCHTRNPGDRLKGVGQVGWSKSTDSLVRHDGKRERYALRHTKPVQVAEYRGDTVHVHCMYAGRHRERSRTPDEQRHL